VVPDVAAAGEGALVIGTAERLPSSGAFRDFEAATGCRVAIRPAPSESALADRPPAGLDLLVLPGEAVLELADRRAIAPLATSRIAGRGDVIAPLADTALAARDTRTYAVPFAWGVDVLLYAQSAFPSPPASWSALYDPAYRGRIVVPDSVLQVANAALVQGASDPFALDRDQLRAAGDLLGRQRKLVRLYWNAARALGPLFADGTVVLGEGREADARDLAPWGVAAATPPGPTTGWSAWWALASGAPHPRCAYKWLNYGAAPAVQLELAQAIGGAPANGRACDLVTEARCEALRLRDSGLLGGLRFARTPAGGMGPWLDAWARARS
jgi:putative spermidine/putrescine transport system substrate-binding protein